MDLENWNYPAPHIKTIESDEKAHVLFNLIQTAARVILE